MFDTEMYRIEFDKEGESYSEYGVTYLNLPNSTLENHKNRLVGDGAVIKKVIIGSGSWNK